jgi:nitronate monooxygenase
MSFLDRIGLEHPIVQAGMGGGIATGALAGEVSAAGGLGTVGMSGPPRFAAQLRLARERADPAPVAANLLVPFVRRAHVDACVASRVSVVALHGGFDRRLVGALREGGCVVLQTVGTVAEAKRGLADGADGLIVQGIEAGGHLVGVEPALAALERIRPVAGAAPLLLAGGIADAADVRRALDAGAAAVVAGTRFLLTHESAAHPSYKQRVLDATRTIETRLFGLGWPMRHRVVPNAATDRWCGRDPLGPRWVRAAQELTRPLARLPESAIGRTHRAQRVGRPVFGPSPPHAGMPDHLVEASALYAGETALRIEELMPAAAVVGLLAGVRDSKNGPSDPLGSGS